MGASVVAGPFGAGLTNMIFAPPGATLIDLQDSTYAPRMWYWNLCCQSGHRYRTLVGRTTKVRAWEETDFTLNRSSFRQLLRSMFDPANADAKRDWFEDGDPGRIAGC